MRLAEELYAVFRDHGPVDPRPVPWGDLATSEQAPFVAMASLIRTHRDAGDADPEVARLANEDLVASALEVALADEAIHMTVRRTLCWFTFRDIPVAKERAVCMRFTALALDLATDGPPADVVAALRELLVARTLARVAVTP